MKKVIANKEPGLTAMRNHNFRRNVFLASLEKGSCNEDPKAQSMNNAANQEILKNIAAFKESLDGLSPKEQRLGWAKRLFDARARFMAAQQLRNGEGGVSPEDAMAIHLARTELICTRRAKKLALSKSIAARNNKFRSQLLRDGFKEEFEEFASSIAGLSEEEQNIQWKNRIQRLQYEARKAHAMVAMTRKMARQFRAAAKDRGNAAAANEEPKEVGATVVHHEEHMASGGVGGSGDDHRLLDSCFEKVVVENIRVGDTNQGDNLEDNEDDAHENILDDDDDYNLEDNEDEVHENILDDDDDGFVLLAS